MKRLYASLILCIGATQMASAQLVLNEIMQSNIDCIMDDLNEFPDSWVELYNSSSSSMNLGEYRLGVTRDANEAYKLPTSTIASHGYQLVYCDKEEGTNWHTPFRLESGKGCAIYLFKGTTIVDSISDLKKQPAPNIAYGRATDGSGTFGYLRTPTPCAANSGDVCERSQILGDPIFSHPGKVYESSASFVLKVTLPDEAPATAVLRYTTDGSEPTESSSLFPTNGFTINTTRTIKVKPFCQGYLSPRASTQSYIFLGRSMTLPVVSITTNNKYLNDSKIGIYVEGNYQSEKKNYEFDWRRPINLELFESPNKEPILNQLCEARVQGGASRGCSLKSLALYANKRFGEKKFDYEFFPEDRPEQTNFESLLLRNAGNDFDYLYMRDAIIQRVMARNTDVDWQAWQPAIVYINGTYKGILNFRERSNDNNIYTNYDGLKDVTVVENWWDVKEGGNSNLFSDFSNFYAGTNHTLAEFEERLDVSEFLDVIIADVYFNNLDAPGNNFTIWRPNAEDGRWRVLMKDMDFTMGLYGQSYDYKYLNWLYDANYDSSHNWGANGSNGTRLFRRLMNIAECRNNFIDRMLVYMGDFLNYNGIWEVWEPMYNEVKTEYPTHRALINKWWPNYNDEVNNGKNWLRNRTPYMYSYLSSYYNLSSPMVLQVNKGLTSTELEQISVSINGVQLSKGIFDGKFPQNREVRLTGENVGQWVVTTQTSSGTTKKTYSGSSATFTMPNCQSVKIMAIVNDPQGIDEVSDETTIDEMAMYDANGRRISHLQNGLNIVVKRQGGKIIREKIMK